LAITTTTTRLGEFADLLVGQEAFLWVSYPRQAHSGGGVNLELGWMPGSMSGPSGWSDDVRALGG
jgi:hypothetical protein